MLPLKCKISSGPRNDCWNLKNFLERPEINQDCSKERAGIVPLTYQMSL